MDLTRNSEFLPWLPLSRHGLFGAWGISSPLPFRAGVPKVMALTSDHPASTYQILITLSQDLPPCDSLCSPVMLSGPWIPRLPFCF